MPFNSVPRLRKEPMSTEEYLRGVFQAQENSRKNRDYTPRTFQPDGSMDTEDFLREVVFGVERPPAWAARPARAEPSSTAPVRTEPSPASPMRAEASSAPRERAEPSPVSAAPAVLPASPALSARAEPPAAPPESEVGPVADGIIRKKLEDRIGAVGWGTTLFSRLMPLRKTEGAIPGFTPPHGPSVPAQSTPAAPAAPVAPASSVGEPGQTEGPGPEAGGGSLGAPAAKPAGQSAPSAWRGFRPTAFGMAPALTDYVSEDVVDGLMQYRGGRALVHGAQDTALGYAWRKKMPDALTPDDLTKLDFWDKVLHGAGQIGGGLPFYAAGGYAGRGGGTPGALGAGMATNGFAYSFMRSLAERGDVKDFDDLCGRLGDALGQAGRDGAVGVATGLGGQALRPLLGTVPARFLGLGQAGEKAIETAATRTGEALAMPTAAAALEGRFATREEYTLSMAMILTLSGAGAVVRGVSGRGGRGGAPEGIPALSPAQAAEAAKTLGSKLRSLEEQTGLTPLQAAEAASERPHLREALLGPEKDLSVEILEESRQLREGYRRVKADPMGGPAVKTGAWTKTLLEEAPQVLKTTNHETGITGLPKANRAIMESPAWAKAKEGNPQAAAQIIEQIWTPHQTQQLQAKLQPGKEIVCLSVPSTSRLNVLPEALGKKLAQELGGTYLDVGEVYKVHAKRPMKELPKSERPFAERSHELLDTKAVASLKDKQVILTEDVITTGSSARRFALELRRQGVEVQTVAGLMGSGRLDAPPQLVSSLQRTLRNAGMPVKGRELADILSAGEIETIIESINTSGGAHARRELTERIQGLLNTRTTGSVAKHPR